MKVNDLRINDRRFDKRCKLSTAQMVEIIENKDGLTIAATARKYGVSPRTIQFLRFPERRKKNRENLKNKGGWRYYYHRDAHKIRMSRHRDYKHRLAMRRFIDVPISELYKKEMYVWPILGVETSVEFVEMPKRKSIFEKLERVEKKGKYKRSVKLK